MMTLLMDELKNNHAWGLSDDKKRPVYAEKFIKTNQKSDLTLVTKKDLQHLSTLIDIESKPQLKGVNKGYHVHAADNLVIAFDVEPRCSNEWLSVFRALPAHYREYSNHYGLHLFFKLNRLKLSKAAFDMVLERTEIKTKENTDDGMLEYEIIMNNHWITVTQNICHGGKILNIDENAPQIVYDVLNRRAEAWEKTNSNSLISVSDISESVSPLAKRIKMTLFNTNDIVDRAKELSIDDFADDDSRYEYNVAIKLAGYLNWRINNPQSFDSSILFGNSVAIHDISISDRIQATALEMEDILPKRAKWNERRNQLPWLVFVAKRAWDYILANDSLEQAK